MTPQPGTGLGSAISVVVVLFLAVVAALTAGFAGLALLRVRSTGEADPWEELLLAGITTASAYSAVNGYVTADGSPVSVAGFTLLGGETYELAWQLGLLSLALLLLWALFRVLLVRLQP